MTTSTAYRTLFQDYLDAGLQLVLAQVQAAEPLVPDDLRRQAWHLLSYAFESDAAWPLARDLLLALAPKMEQAGFRDEWIAYLEQGLRQSQRFGDALTAAECQLHIGQQHRLQGAFALAHQWFAASLVGFTTLDLPQCEARVLNQIAYLEYLQRQYVEARQHVHQALALLSPSDPERAMNFRIMGLVATEVGQLHDAELYHRQALAILEEVGDQRRRAWSLQNLGYTLRGQQRFDEAIDCFQQAAVVLNWLNDTYNWAVVQNTLGMTYQDCQQPELAVACLAQAERIFRQMQDRAHLARVTTNQGISYATMKDWHRAEVAFLNSIDLHHEIGDEAWRLNAVDGLAMTYLALDRYTDAIEILLSATEDLPKIIDAPNYEYLKQALSEHLRKAQSKAVPA